MINLEEYELKYNLFLAEQELYTNMINIGGSCIYESVGLISIQESLKDTVINYLEKLRESLMKVFQRFKEIVIDPVVDRFTEKIKPKVSSTNPEFTIENFPQYSIDKLKSIKIVPLNVETMKDDLESKDKFISKYYQQLVGEGSIKERMEKFVKGNPIKKRADKNLLDQSIEYLTKTIPAELKNIQTEINQWVASSKVIEQLASTPGGEVNQTTVSVSSNGQVNTSEAVALYEAYLLEEDDPKPEIKDDPGSEKSDEGKTFTKNMVSYCSVCIDILTAKMSIYRDIYKLHFKILTHQFGTPKREEEKKQNP